MFARAASGTVVGVDAEPVVVETHRAKGLPGVTLIGLARGAARESVVRVRSAIRASDITLSRRAQVINLLPADLPKDGSSLDLPVAISWLASAGFIPESALQGRRFYGELGLSGTLEPVRGAILVTDLARRSGDEEIFLPTANAAEAAIIPGIHVLGAATLKDVVQHLLGLEPLPAQQPENRPPQAVPVCLSEVVGQTAAKRALEIAAAGGHNLLMKGPPGSGKTMLARRLPTLLPPLSCAEQIEVTRIFSAARRLEPVAGLVSDRPFRAPHHTISEAALCGGGSIPRPGEITLAHRGVLFLDELPEFSRRALESLREPLEEGVIHVARAARSICFPARVMLVAAMNPCPCGFYVPPGSNAGASSPPTRQPCLCTFDQIRRYRSRISGPLLDRIDLLVPVESVSFQDYLAGGSGESSCRVRQRVVRARRAQAQRLGDGRTNASMTEDELRQHVPLDERGLALIEAALERDSCSTRAIARLLKVARTIADLSGDEMVTADHLQGSLAWRGASRSNAGSPATLVA